MAVDLGRHPPAPGNANPAPAVVFTVCLLNVLPVLAQDVAIPRLPPDEPDAKDNWLDRSHQYVTARGDALARRLDQFFGAPVSDIETASSIVRLATIYEMDEIESDGYKIRVRGKLKLPRAKRRLSLVFTGEDGDTEGEFRRASEDSDSDQVGLQVVYGEGGRSRFDLFGTVGSGLNARAGVRYRFQDAPSKRFSWHFIEQLAYDQEDKTISTTRLELDQLVDWDTSLRWAGRIRYGEDTDGVEWRSSFGWREAISDRKAVTYFVGINGITDPKHLTRSYGPGIRYRQNIFRKYLYLDLVPSYGWRKGIDDDDREGAWSFEVRLEIFFEKNKEDD